MEEEQAYKIKNKLYATRLQKGGFFYCHGGEGKQNNLTPTLSMKKKSWKIEEEIMAKIKKKMVF